MNTTNKKLTHLIAGRTVKQTSQNDGHLQIEFADVSVMKIKSSDPAPECAGRIVKIVKQKETDFEFVFTAGLPVKITLAEDTSSVMLRDMKDVLEYAD